MNKINNIKKFSYVIMLVVNLLLLVACSKKEVNDNIKNIKDVENKEKKIVVTTFPLYDMVKELGKGIDNIKLTLLMDNGVDLHNYSPTSKDIINIGNSDMFVYIGGESDKWATNVFSSINFDDSKKLNLMECLKNELKEEELKEGMEDIEEECEEDSENEEETEYDEHIWLSIKNAKKMCAAIKNKLELFLIDEEKNLLNENYENYIKELNNLDNEYEKVFDKARKDNKEMTLVFADRFPFLYMFNDYGLNYFAAFKGCSAESEASFKTVMFLADKCNELGLKYIFVIDGSDKKIANTVKDNVKASEIEILVLDSLQGKTNVDINNGVTYINVMKKNLDIMKKYFE